MACLELATEELESDGWLVNQTRMWLASHWSVRSGLRWQDGERYFFRHLLDGSRAPNRMGWQWTLGLSSTRSYGFSRVQVERGAPGLCATCPSSTTCPIEAWPDQTRLEPTSHLAPVVASDADPRRTAGPTRVLTARQPGAVWLTAESLGAADPALAANPELPAVFVFDERLLTRLGLTAKRLVFLTECLAELATERPVELWRGDPARVVADREVAVTFAPVPGFRRLLTRLEPAQLHPWPWLKMPNGRSVSSFSAWLRSLRS
jgi:deoxyribodipyrimidine photo-lyase